MLRVVTPSRSASSGPLHTGRCCSSASSRSTRSVVPISAMPEVSHPQRTGSVRIAGEGGPMTPTSPVWNPLLLDQLEFHWTHALRPRLEGLTDEEYRWEPAPGAWSIRPRGSGVSPAPIGSGRWERDDAPDDPEPAPLTTIAWRLAHITVEVLAMRSASHFGRAPAHYASWTYAGT